MMIRVFITILGLWRGLAIPPGPADVTATTSPQSPPHEGPPRRRRLDGPSQGAGSDPHGTPRTDLRWIGARTTCTWIGSAEEQLYELRHRGLGAEPTWLAVLHRIQHRNEPGFHRWCSGFLKQLRRHFGRELNVHLHHRRLVDEEIQWAAQVEYTAYQDFLHYVRGRRDAVECLPHLSSDDVILSTRPAQHEPPQYPFGVFQATWVDGETREWGGYATFDLDFLGAMADPGDVATGSMSAAMEDGDGQLGTDLESGGPVQETPEDEVVGLFQLPVTVEVRWQRLIEQLHDWLEEGLAAGLAVRMARDVAEQIREPGFLEWAGTPLHTLGAGIPFSDGASAETTPPRMRAWASEVVECLVLCFRTELEQGMQPAELEDEVSFMDRDRRQRHGRRRYRDSRSPRRGTRPTCAASAHQGTASTRAERIAARQAANTRSGRGSNGESSEYVEVHLEEAPREEEVVRGEPSAASGGHGASRASRTEPPGPTSGASPASARPTGCGTGQGEVTLPHPRRPMTLTQGIDLWRYLLFSRTTFGPELEPGSRIPNNWLPSNVIRDVCTTHETMSQTNRGISTLALLSVLRFLAQELTETVQHADTIARSREVGRRHGEPEEEDEELLLQVSMDLYQHPLEDEVVLMQGFFVATEGRDTPQQRWARGLLRLQKELVGQRKDKRRANVQGLLTSLRAVPHGPMNSEWGEQLQALLMVLLEDTTEVESPGEVNVEWLQAWLAELSTFIPGMQMWGSPILVEVDSQPQTTSSGGDHHLGEGVTHREIEDLLRVELEERELRHRESEHEDQRQADYERLCRIEEEHLRREAADYQAWEDSQIRRYLADTSPASASRKRCILQVELSSGSGDRPVRRQTLALEVPDDGSESTVVIRARMEPDQDGVETQCVPSPQPDPDVQLGPEPAGDQGFGDSMPAEGISQEGQCGTVPELLPHLEFHEYEAVYDKWCKAELTTEEVARTYGKQVVEMLQAQFVLSAEVDFEKGGVTQLDDVETAANQLDI